MEEQGMNLKFHIKFGKNVIRMNSEQTSCVWWVERGVTEDFTFSIHAP
jgi:hypothetical protein